MTGIPRPTIRWFRGAQEITQLGITFPNGTIWLNVNRGEKRGAALNGTLYHCTATNIFGTIRSRDINVTFACKILITVLHNTYSATFIYADYDGFEQKHETTVPVQLGARFALECSWVGSNPPLEVTWYKGASRLMDHVRGIDNFIRILDNGRFVYFRQAMMEDLDSYTCKVKNPLLTTVWTHPLIHVTSSLHNGQFIVYKNYTNHHIVRHRDNISDYFIAAYGGTHSFDPVSILCINDNVESVTNPDDEAQYTYQMPTKTSGMSSNMVTITCVHNMPGQSAVVRFVVKVATVGR